jgi:DNA-binding LytR/AlgR family response regulator
MRKISKSGSRPAAAERSRLFLLHPAPGLRDTIDPDDIFFLEAHEGDTSVRTRRARRLRDVRTLGELEPILRQWGFVRTHRNYVVNPNHVRQVRLRRGSKDWELKLDPPVNRVLPVSRSALADLWAAFGED